MTLSCDWVFLLHPSSPLPFFPLCDLRSDRRIIKATAVAILHFRIHQKIPTGINCFSFSSRLQPDQNRIKKDASHSADQEIADSSTSAVREAASKESQHQTSPALDLAPPVSEDEELTPEEVQMVTVNMH